MKASVIIPTYNACERLYYTLNALNQQDCPRDMFEVILVNNGSTDNTARMLPTLKLNYKIVYITIPKVKSRAYARNHGIQRANNELIIFIDSDMLADRSFIRKHIEAHTFEKSIVCGKLWSRIFTYYYPNFSNSQKDLFIEHVGRRSGVNVSDYRNQRTTIVRIDQIANESYKNFCFDAPTFYKDLWQLYGNTLEGYCFEWLFFVTKNCSVRKSSIYDAGLFDESFTGWGAEDTDMGYRLFKKGYKLIVQPDIQGAHQEHPRSAYDANTTTDNKALLLHKHNSLDILLFFLGGSFGLDISDTNNVMLDINYMKKDLENNHIIELFGNALIDQRNTLYNKASVFNRKNIDEEYIKASYASLIKSEKSQNFAKALYKLFNLTYDLSFDI